MVLVADGCVAAEGSDKWRKWHPKDDSAGDIGAGQRFQSFAAKWRKWHFKLESIGVGEWLVWDVAVDRGFVRHCAAGS